MDNLQRHYIEQLEFANAAALHGNLQDCLNTCFELRLKSDLALWTRAYVNITLANFTHVQTHPDKNKFAEEALRIVRELKTDKTLGDNAVERASYDKLETIAMELVKVTNEEVRAFKKCWEEDEQKRQQKVDEDKMVEDKTTGVPPGGGGSVDVQELRFENDRKLRIQPWNIEGAFSTLPVTEKADDIATLQDDEIKDELTELPNIAVRGRSKSRSRAQVDRKSGLITPAASSDVDTD